MVYVESRLPAPPSPAAVRLAEARRQVLIILLDGLAFTMFFPLFSAAELSIMLAVNRKFRDVIESYRRSAHDIDKLLLMFFTLVEIQRFRELQSFDGFLISGSIALQYFARVVWPDSDLDIYCYPKHFARLVRLLGAFGYDYIPDAGQTLDLHAFVKVIQEGVGDLLHYDSRQSISAVLSFTRVTNGVSKKVQVVVCQRSPMEAILKFHSTVVMNFIGPTHAVCLYPYSTLHLLQSIRLLPDRKASAALAKANELIRDRAVGDRATWILALRGTGIPFDPNFLFLKWHLAHSWSHESESCGIVRIVFLVGGRCSWKRPITFATACGHLRLHGHTFSDICSLCAQETVGYARVADIYHIVHQSVETAPSPDGSDIDRFVVDYLYKVFSRLPGSFGAFSEAVMPDAFVAMSAYAQIRSVLHYFRADPKVVISFHYEQPFVVTNLHVHVPVPSDIVSDAVALLKCSNVRRPRVASGLTFKVVLANSRTINLDYDHHLMPRMKSRNPGVRAGDLPMSRYLIMIDQFIDSVIHGIPERSVDVGEVVPTTEAREALKSCLHAFYYLFNSGIKVLWSWTAL
ncbi:hypothetical protein V5O48_003682 [Marasmius crinis-equi]|uniref:Uncharacterized protein n=1 Tax=Marasmius crinis-equi TaxID=585013 RepID=A0ABR3FS55_9AGAR